MGSSTFKVSDSFLAYQPDICYIYSEDFYSSRLALTSFLCLVSKYSTAHSKEQSGERIAE